MNTVDIVSIIMASTISACLIAAVSVWAIVAIRLTQKPRKNSESEDKQ